METLNSLDSPSLLLNPLGSSLQSLGPLLRLLHDRQLDTLAAWQSHPRLRPLSHREHIPHSGRESLARRVRHVDDVEAPFVLLAVLDHTDPPPVTPSGHHHDVADVELDELHHLPRLQVDLHGVVGLDQGVRVPGMQRFNRMSAAQREVRTMIPDPRAPTNKRYTTTDPN
jgi:hypothetical protein